MSRVKYEHIRFQAKTLKAIQQADTICEEYALQGFALTGRQLFYQLVSRNEVLNDPDEYKKLLENVRKGRMSGLVDWDHIVDRTRQVHIPSSYEHAGQILEESAMLFRRDPWEASNQGIRPEVWVEKDALIDVVEQACNPYQVPCMSIRGYSSITALRDGALRLKRHMDRGLRPIVFYLGDHDPTGLQIAENIGEKLALFAGEPIKVNRIGLTLEQVRIYGPPPNTPKETDSRTRDYVAQFGNECWELDALEPRDIINLIQDHLRGCITDVDSWNQVKTEDAETRNQLLEFASTFNPGGDRESR